MRSRQVALWFLPLLAAFAVSFPAWEGDLIRDDVLYVIQNPQVVAPAPLGEVFQTPFQPTEDLGLWRPLTTLSLRADFWLSHRLGLAIHTERAVLPHLSNALLAGLAGLCAIVLARRLGFPAVAASLLATLWVILPARSEALLWVSGRAELLMCLGAALALAAAASPRRGWPLLPLALGVAISFCGKEQGLVLALLVPLVPGPDRRARITRSAVTLAVLGALFALRYEVLGAIGPEGSQQVLTALNEKQRWQYGITAFGEYMRLIIWPHPLLNEYDEPSRAAAAWTWIPALAFLATGLFTVVARQGRLAFALLLFALPLGPVLNLVYVTGESFAERFLALPALGALLGLFLGLQRWPQVLCSALLGATLLAAVLTTWRATEWSSEEALVAAHERAAPNSAGAHFLRAGMHEQLANRARFETDSAPAARRHQEAAAEALRRAWNSAPHQPNIGVRLANLLVRLGQPQRPGASMDLRRLQEGLEIAEQVARAAPQVAEAHQALGRALVALKRTDSAMAAFERALAIEPRDVESRFQLHALYRQFGREAEAADLVRQALAESAREAERRPFAPGIPRFRAQLFFLSGDPEAALAELARSARLASTPRALSDAAADRIRYFRTQRMTDEIFALADATLETLEGWLEETRDHSEIFVAMSEMERLRGRDEEAIRLLRRAAEAADRPLVARAWRRLADELERMKDAPPPQPR